MTCFRMPEGFARSMEGFTEGFTERFTGRLASASLFCASLFCVASNRCYSPSERLRLAAEIGRARRPLAEAFTVRTEAGRALDVRWTSAPFSTFSTINIS